MNAVNRGVVIGRRSVGWDVIDILVFIYGNLHQAVCCGNLLSFAFVVFCVEVAALTPYCMDKNQRDSGLGCLDCLDKAEEVFLDGLVASV